MGTWFRRLAYVLRQSRHDAELREEIESHRALRAAQLERDGMSAQDAAAGSRRAVGNVVLAREDVRDVWLGSWGSWWQDVRYGLRGFRRNPTFTAVAVLTLALGIGVNAGIFTVVNAVLFRDLTAADAHELVSVYQSVQGIEDFAGQETFSTAEYFAYRDRAQTFSGLAALGTARGEATLDGDTPRLILGALVSCNFFAVLRQPPALGRAFAPADCEPGADLVVVLSHPLWQTAFASDAGIVGRTIRLNRQLATVVGVTAPGGFAGTGFVGGGYLAPLGAGRRLASGDTRYTDTAPWLNLLGRRRSDVALEQVSAELDVIAAQLDRERPGRSTTLAIERGVPVTSRDTRAGAVGAAAVLMGAFGLILLIACANVANLLLARGASRTQEIGIRASLGASRARVVRQLVTESVLLSSAGGLLGSVAAFWSFQSLVALAIPALLPPWFPLTLQVDLSVDAEVLAFATLLTIATGILFGLAPALHASKADVHALIKQDAAGPGTGRRGSRLRGALVGVQVALCMVLMIAAGLLLRGLQTTYSVDPGFEYRDVALVSLESAFAGDTQQENQVRRRRLLADLEALPGVAVVASADHKPLGDDSSPQTIRLPGEGANQDRTGEFTSVTEDYFAALELPIVRGRAFTVEEVTDRRQGPAIVSAATARNLWPGADPIGQTFVASRAGTLQVVGVVADAQITAIGRIDPYQVYVPGGGAAVLVKRRGDIATTVAAIGATLRTIDSTLVVPVLPLEATLGWSRGISGTVTSLFGGLGLLALVLAAVGIYGVVSYAVTGRHREIGIRLALGATAWSVVTLMLRQTMRPVVVGAIVGVAAATAVSRVLASVLFGISPVDLLGLGGASLLVLGVSVAAGLLAAWPATGADPVATLRAE
jgi:predicted permease